MQRSDELRDAVFFSCVNLLCNWLVRYLHYCGKEVETRRLIEIIKKSIRKRPQYTLTNNTQT